MTETKSVSSMVRSTIPVPAASRKGSSQSRTQLYFSGVLWVYVTKHISAVVTKEMLTRTASPVQAIKLMHTIHSISGECRPLLMSTSTHCSSKIFLIMPFIESLALTVASLEGSFAYL
eukprot:CAMPEP_0181459618 /NCGR_PEP_ID=MMETSP1110-20121109/32918_1 /TAXON_ID=174948 /ORGANISM="Symbiodinium sp., Strain CCMP421" /LENGTH=117 /DNA_ID=CAMNT_0023584143 /DNA_START=517 /DNA_END=870 /DNA_ORIENTATION=-